MTNNDILKNIEKAGKIVGTVAVAVTPVVAVAGAVAEKVSKTVSAKSEDENNLVLIPSLYSEGKHLTVEEVKRRLEDRELKPELTLALKNIKYKDCVDQEVVETNPKEKQKVKKGSFVEVFYVTSEVIEESRSLFKASERQKAEIERSKLNEKLEKLKMKIQHECERHEKVMQKLNEGASHIRKDIERWDEFIENSQEGAL